MHTYELIGVTRRFRAGSLPVVAVDCLDLAVDGPEFLVIQGRSGSGKSTLLQLMAGLDRADAGQVRYDGRDLGRLSDRELTSLRLHAFGFVFQSFNLIPTLTAAENVEAALAPTGMPRRRRRALIEELLSEVGLRDRAAHLPSQLSGGEQQRIAIARALANRPRVLLADEPTGNLDTQSAADVRLLLEELARAHVLTVVLVTHDPAMAAGATRLLRMSDGKLADSGTVAEALQTA
jgi:putative ABC transport system ATP-binding protein